MANGSRTWDPNSGTSQTTGFSVIELLIVIAIVVVIAAIAIPNLLRSKVAANEASAIGSLRNIMSAEAAYKAMYGIGYSNDLASIGGTSTTGADASCTAAQLLDASLAKGVIGNKTRKSGYVFTFTPGKEAFKPEQAVPSGCDVGKGDGYAVQADPVDSRAGKRHFCADASGVIRFDANREIDVTAPVCAGSAAPLQ
ncbi:MAG TPA: prepilin-type N-terminal cleavage/methylation domain-containing protein [Candidatus Acidoferrales bacterium]|nr:prepilin-type N-terminal cleavage/methylation domain-containing protein [Candidatus Acidoferrales bacterium]